MGKADTQTETLTRLQNIDAYEFEEFVGDLWSRDGWETTVSQGSRDLGLDVEAVKWGTIDQKLAIQAKRYSDGNKVGRPKIQQYHSLKEQDTDADAAVVVTTSSFTSNAEDWARDHNVKLVDGKDLLEMIDRLNAYDLVETYAPSLSALEAEDESTDESSTSNPTTTVEATTSSKNPRQYLGYLFVALLIQITGFAVAGIPSLLPSIPSSVAGGAAIIGHLASPFLIVADAHRQRTVGADYQPSRAFWFVLTFALPVLTVAIYIYRRETK